MGSKVKDGQSKMEDSPSSNLDDLKDRNKDKIRIKIKGKTVDSKYINVKVLKSMMPSKRHRIVTNACDLILQKQKKKALKALTNKKPEEKKVRAEEPSTSQIKDSEDEMDWETTESEVMSSLQELRRTSFQTNSTGADFVMTSSTRNWTHSGVNLNVVVDTNIFLCHLSTVKMLVENKSFKGKVCVHVAWTVLQELDYMKTNNDKKNKLELLARKAGKFLFEQTQLEGNFFRIQSLQEFKDSCSKLPVGNNSDDKILQWCLELNHEHPSVVLLSNDINFCTKASACGIQALPREQFIDKLQRMVNSLPEKLPVEISIPVSSAIKSSEPTHRNDSVAQAIEKEANFVISLESCLTEPLGKLLHDEMKKVYEELWQKIVLIKPPWKLLDIIRCVDKHWIAVFSYVYPKDWRESLLYLKTTLYQSKTSLLEPEMREAVLEKSINILQVVQKCRKEYHEFLEERIKSLERLLQPVIVPQPEIREPSVVLDLFTRLWIHLEYCCGIILDATHVEHQIQYVKAGILPSYDQVISSLQLLLTILPSLDSSMSQFVTAAVNVRGHSLDSFAIQFATCIVSVVDRLQLNLLPELNLTLATLSRQLVDFVTLESNQRMMENGLQQLRSFIELLRVATGRCLPIAFQS